MRVAHSFMTGLSNHCARKRCFSSSYRCIMMSNWFFFVWAIKLLIALLLISATTAYFRWPFVERLAKRGIEHVLTKKLGTRWSCESLRITSTSIVFTGSTSPPITQPSRPPPLSPPLSPPLTPPLTPPPQACRWKMGRAGRGRLPFRFASAGYASSFAAWSASARSCRR